jgi:hypothetical protein
MSGFPGSVETFLRYRSPARHKARRRMSSGFVLAFLLDPRAADEACAEAGASPA